MMGLKMMFETTSVASLDSNSPMGMSMLLKTKGASCLVVVALVVNGVGLH
jgi:hypothetical protein